MALQKNRIDTGMEQKDTPTKDTAKERRKDDLSSGVRVLMT